MYFLIEKPSKPKPLTGKQAAFHLFTHIKLSKMNNLTIKKLRHGALMLLAAMMLACKAPVAAQTVPDSELEAILLADPAMLYHKGLYYLYGTGGTKLSNQGFVVYTSRDGKVWEGPKGVKNGYALHKGDAFGDNQFWAPQVFHFKNKFYMAYAANENIAIAQSDSPLGPFTQQEKIALPAPVKQIDPFVFIDADGTKYLYHVQVANGGNRMFVAELKDDFSGIKTETLRPCIEASEKWENTESAKWSVTEGPTVFKHKGYYYFVYSANDFRSPDYAVGYAVSKSPYGPWEKYTGNPILSRHQLGHNGSGHGDFVQDKQGNWRYVFHTHQSNTTVSPRKTAVIQARFSKGAAGKPDKIRMDEKSFYFLKAKK
jgi:xylan 1,4-beta-xylosidase